MQAYIARKIEGKEDEISGESSSKPSEPLLKESESCANAVTPANIVLKSFEPGGTALSAAFSLDPQQDRRAVKRSRVGSFSTISVQPPSGLASQITLRVDDDPEVHATDEELTTVVMTSLA